MSADPAPYNLSPSMRAGPSCSVRTTSVCPTSATRGRPSDLLHRHREVAQRVVERDLAIGRLVALSDDERARKAELACCEFLRPDARDDDAPRRDPAPVLDDFGPRNVENRGRPGEHD